MRIGLASDHVGFEHKERLKARVIRQGHEYQGCVQDDDVNLLAEVHVERGGPAGRTLGYCLQAAAELRRFFEPEGRQRSDSSASRNRGAAKVCRRSSTRSARAALAFKTCI